MKNIIFIAPPSAGKGTQSDILVEKYNYKHLSTGNLLRAEIAAETDLGKEVKVLMDNGELVGDEIITELLKKELSKYVSDNNFILDGYPRNISQAETLNNIFEELGINDYVAIYLDIDKQTAMERALGRVACEHCGATYNIYYDKMKPQTEGICDKCHNPIIQRSDDNEETFNKRFDTYIEKTSPIIDYYKNLSKLATVKVCEEKADTAAGVEAVIQGE